MIGLGGLIGGGIFSVLGVVTSITGPYSYISYLVMGLIALLAIYSYINLYNKWGSGSGGEYSIVKISTHESDIYYSAFVGIQLYFGYIGMMALYAYTFASYTMHLFNVEYNYIILSIIIIIIILLNTLINLGGLEELTIVENILVITKLVILSGFVFFGLIFIFKEVGIDVFKTRLGLNKESIKSFNMIDIIIGSSSLIISFTGFQLIGNLCPEMVDREKGIKTMRYSVIYSLIIYVLVAITAIGVMTADGIVGDNPHDAEIAISLSAEKFMWGGGIIIGVGALFSTSSAINATLLGSSRLAYEMAHEHIFPTTFRKINHKTKVPTNSILFTSLIIIVVALTTGGALAIAGLADLIFAQVFFIMNVINFRYNKETGSKKIWSLVGMLCYGALFIVLIIYFFTTLRENGLALLLFVGIEIISVYGMERKKINKKIHHKTKQNKTKQKKIKQFN